MKIKFQDSDSLRLFITSDLHLNHNKEFLYGARGFDNVAKHNESVIESINSKCRDNDILFVLGDFCLNAKYDQFLDFVCNIRCKMWFLNGNHPNPWLKEYNIWSKMHHYCEYAFGVQWLNKIICYGDQINLIWNNQMFVCSHFPLLVFDESKRGSIHLHGHCHGNLKSSLPNAIEHGKILDVGWDVFRSPIGFDEIMKIMATKPIKSYDGLH